MSVLDVAALVADRPPAQGRPHGEAATRQAKTRPARNLHGHVLRAQ
jgi:hypothetical protein